MKVETLDFPKSISPATNPAGYNARADRKCGEWLQENVKQGGDRKSEKSKLQVATLNNLGIEKTENAANGYGIM